MNVTIFSLSLLIVFFCQACTKDITTPINVSSKNLKLIRAQAFDETWHFHKSPIGGISGIAYDKKHDHYIAVSDDRGEHDSPRLFVFKISEDSKRPMVEIEKVIYITHENGQRFQKDYVDLEAITLTYTGRILLANEGIHAKDDKKREVTDILVLDKNAKLQYRIPPPKYYFPNQESIQTQGVRDNKGFESLSLTLDGKFLFAGLEAPLTQDGDRSTLTSGSYVRLLKLKKNGDNFHPHQEFVYPLSPLPFPKDGTPEELKEMRKEYKGGNGLVELIALDEHNLYALERSYSPTLKMNHIDLFKVNISADATDVLGKPNLKEIKWITVDKYPFASVNAFETEMKKFGVNIDNIEAMALGPKSKSGKQTLLLVSDNNFSKNQKTIFLLFEILN